MEDINLLKAQEILDYCLMFLGTDVGTGFLDITEKEYKSMLKDIKFMIENS